MGQRGRRATEVGAQTIRVSAKAKPGKGQAVRGIRSILTLILTYQSIRDLAAHYNIFEKNDLGLFKGNNSSGAKGGLSCLSLWCRETEHHSRWMLRTGEVSKGSMGQEKYVGVIVLPESSADRESG